MAWITITEDHLAERLAAAELTAVQTAATGDAGNPVPEVLAAVVSEIRGRIAANPSNCLGEAGTIPEELRAAALAIARWRVLSRLPGMRMLQDDARRMEYNDALALLAAVAKGDFAIEQPEDPISADIGGALPPDVGDPRTQFENLDGV
ncbi:MAG: DUF1320 domain-containing protein [Opitutae bacterium]|nr:DUF1320 domain-containing protein [Opitutae bacterium]